MTPDSTIKVMIRKRLIALNAYSEINVERVFKFMTNDGLKLEGAVITSDPQIISILDAEIKKILSEQNFQLMEQTK